MAHVLILGMTESGKTTLARNLAGMYRAKGGKVLVLDPLADPRWPCDFITSDADEFLEVFWSSRRCFAFMDEGGESVGRYDAAMQKTATRGRHWGHSCHYIAQRATQMAPIIRDQCRHLFLFASSRKDGEELAREWNRDELLECSALKQGEYIHAEKFGAISRHQIGAKSDVAIRTSGRSNRRNGGNPDRQAGEERDATGTGTETGGDGNEGGDTA